MSQQERPKQKRGFALMDPAEQREIASLGGVAAHRMGKAHKFTREEASLAGKKGGKRSVEAKRAKKLAAKNEQPQ